MTILRVLNHFSTQLQTSTSSTNFPILFWCHEVSSSKGQELQVWRGVWERGRPRDCPFCLGWKEGGGGGGGGGENNILAETGLTAAWTRRRSPDRTKQFSRNQDRGRVKPSLIAFTKYIYYSLTGISNSNQTTHYWRFNVTNLQHNHLSKGNGP